MSASDLNDAACEEIVSSVLDALTKLYAILMGHTADLEERTDVAEAKTVFALSGALPHPIVDAHVLALLRGSDRVVTWAMEIARPPASGTWEIERRLEIESADDEWELEYEFPLIVGLNSVEFAQKLPGLAGELLARGSKELPLAT